MVAFLGVSWRGSHGSQIWGLIRQGHSTSHKGFPAAVASSAYHVWIGVDFLDEGEQSERIHRHG